MSPRKRYWVFGAVFLFAVIADQATKIWARAALKPRHESIVVIANFFDFRYSENTGSAFGLFRNVAGARYILLGVGLIALGVVFSFLRKTKPEQLRIAGELGLLAGGAIGNIIDRIFFNGRVTDFVVWKYHQHEWPTFNVADAALVVGVIALLFDMRGEEPKAAEDKPAPDEEKPRRKKRQRA